jgi:tetratricopeptide (TPR) repeat protein
MPDSIPSPVPWLVDADLVSAMRREHAEAALLSGSFDRALAEAEELLYDSPRDPSALWISARAALSLGDAYTAESALNQLLSLEEEDRPISVAELHAELSFARFLQADFGEARAAATTALALNRGLASAWVFLGLAEERLGRLEETEAAYARAESLEPGTAPRRATPPAPATWERLLEAAKQHLSTDEAQMLNGLEVSWHTMPDVAVLRSVEPAISPFIDLLISGKKSLEPASDDSILEQLDAALKQAVPTPSLLTIYTANLRRGQPSTADIVDRLATALRREIAAWLGIPVQELSGEEP